MKELLQLCSFSIFHIKANEISISSDSIKSATRFAYSIKLNFKEHRCIFDSVYKSISFDNILNNLVVS